MKPWDGIQRLTRPISGRIYGGPWIDTFYRESDQTWVVWSLPRAEQDRQHHQVCLLGSFKNRTFARLTADTLLCVVRQPLGLIPMMVDLLHPTDPREMFRNIRCVADQTPWSLDTTSGLVMPRLSAHDIERLTQQLEHHLTTVQDWRFYWDQAENQMLISSLVRVRNRKQIAKLRLEPHTFNQTSVSFWLLNQQHSIVCDVAQTMNAMLSTPVLNNVDRIMRYCDVRILSQYGAESNTEDMIRFLRQEGHHEAHRQLSCALGRHNRIGMA